MSDRINTIAVVGGGLVGSVMACYLAQRGYKVELFERREDPRVSLVDSGRSINLALSNRGWKALKELGLENDVKKLVIPMHGRMMHDESGSLTFQRYGREGEAINSVSRGGLNNLLVLQAEKLGIKTHFAAEVSDVDFEQGILTFVDGSTHRSDLIIGADGAYSMLRYQMQRTERFNFSQHYIEYGYKELSIPADGNGTHRIETNALHIWPRGKFMLIALPNLDGSFTCTLFLPFEGSDSFEKLNSDEDIRQFFHVHFPDTRELMPGLLEDFAINPTSSLVTIRCFPWSRDRVLLIGDAAHGIVPFYGQGMNCGFEDCRVLNEMLDAHGDNWTEVIPLFEDTRKPDTEAIADLALGNFHEMRDLVADDDFLLRKKIEARLYSLYPDQWIPLYSMVTFKEDMRYSQALERGKIQQKIMDKVMQTDHIEESWETADLSWVIRELPDPA